VVKYSDKMYLPPRSSKLNFNAVHIGETRSGVILFKVEDKKEGEQHESFKMQVVWDDQSGIRNTDTQVLNFGNIPLPTTTSTTATAIASTPLTTTATTATASAPLTTTATTATTAVDAAPPAGTRTYPNFFFDTTFKFIANCPCDVP
jgi:hypothetical protein